MGNKTIHSSLINYLLENMFVCNLPRSRINLLYASSWTRGYLRTPVSSLFWSVNVHENLAFTGTLAPLNWGFPTTRKFSCKLRDWHHLCVGILQWAEFLSSPHTLAHPLVNVMKNLGRNLAHSTVFMYWLVSWISFQDSPTAMTGLSPKTHEGMYR